MAVERVISAGLRRPTQTPKQFASLMEELRRLVNTAGGMVVKELTQTRSHPDPGTLLGRGKLDEIAEEALKTGVRTVVFDDDLTPAQQKNIEKRIHAKIVDRTRLILDIFAARARSRDGQLQVELAQLNYLVPRLTGAWRGFSQQMGGIGTRGPGERKIEVERRYVRERIKRLKKEINEIRAHRNRIRASRQSVPLPQVSLVGYTNVGKSTLLNTLVGDPTAVYADDKLFATLDPTTRRIRLPGGRTVLFTDTVGFIQKLPHTLVAAFHATLEEVALADLLVHVVDPAIENWEEQSKNVLKVLKDLKASHVPAITVYNKADLLTHHQKKRFQDSGEILVSSRSREGMRDLLEAVESKLDESLVEVSFQLPHDKRPLLADIYRTGHILSERPGADGVHLRIRIDPANWERISHRLSLKDHDKR